MNNIAPGNLIMKEEKESVQKSALALFKGSEIVFNTFKTKMILSPIKKSEKPEESLELHKLWSQGLNGRTLKSDSPTRIF